MCVWQSIRPGVIQAPAPSIVRSARRSAGRSACRPIHAMRSPRTAIAASRISPYAAVTADRIVARCTCVHRLSHCTRNSVGDARSDARRDCRRATVDIEARIHFRDVGDPHLAAGADRVDQRLEHVEPDAARRRRADARGNGGRQNVKADASGRRPRRRRRRPRAPAMCRPRSCSRRVATAPRVRAHERTALRCSHSG